MSLKRVPRYAPRGPRAAVDIEACLLLPNDRLIPVTLRNLSRDGFMATTSSPVRPNSWIGVALAGYGIVRARVRWNEAGEVGCQFRIPLDTERLRQALAGTAGDAPLYNSPG